MAKKTHELITAGWRNSGSNVRESLHECSFHIACTCDRMTYHSLSSAIHTQLGSASEEAMLPMIGISQEREKQIADWFVFTA